MIRQVTLNGFRAYRSLTSASLARINLVLGQNNVGKTSFLEALFLLCGPMNPEITLKLISLRGVAQFRNDPDELWGWLFHRKQTSNVITLTASLSSGGTRVLTIKSVEAEKATIYPVRDKRKVKRRPITSATTGGTFPELEFQLQDERGRKFTAWASIRDTGIDFRRDRPIKTPTTILMSGRGGYLDENAERYSKLEEVGRHEELYPALQVLEPRLRRLAVLVTGNGPVLHADVGLGKMIPLHFMGDGIGRFASILLAIASCEKGMTLIDEIDTGLHYSAMVAAWAAVAEMARRYDVQVVATTHSYDCLKAAAEVFNDDEDESSLSVLRLERVGDDVEAVEFTPEMLDAAIATGLELR